MKHLAGVAIDAGCKRFQWAVLDWNAPAIGFYQSLGAGILSDWRTVRVDGEALRALATL
jgi:Acetyltransferase (GNAT) family